MCIIVVSRSKKALVDAYQATRIENANRYIMNL